MTSNQLKWIALVTMTIDHIGYAFAERMPYETYLILRGVGRLAMPIFCFLIAEGLYHTRDVRKYLLRLAVFAVASEVPFDLFLFGDPIDWRYQNVGVTLFLGLLAILFFDTFAARGQKILALVAVLAAGGLAVFLKSDYETLGVFFVFLFYYFRGKNKAALTVLLLVAEGSDSFRMLAEGYQLTNLYTYFGLLSPLALIAIFAYNGKKGSGSGRLLYAFYPLHLLLIAGLRFLL